MFQKPIAFAVAALMLAGCTQTTTTTTETTTDTVAVAPAAPTPVPFTAVYHVPLAKVSPEDYPADVVRPEFLEKNNLGVLKPALEKMLKDAFAGKVKAYPESGTDPENNPDTYFTRTAKAMAEKGHKIDVSSLSQCLRVENACMDMGDYSTLSPEWLILLRTDPKGDMPELATAKISVADLQPYSIEVGGHSMNLQDIIINGDFEKYVVSIQGPTENTLLSDIANVASLQEKINKGDIH